MNLKSLRKFNISFKPVISNTPLLYAIALLSCLDIMYMFQSNKFNALFVFFLTAMIMTYFSKNMMIILFFALVITHIFRFGSNVSEGMESKNKDNSDEEDKNGENDEESSEDKPKKKADIDEVVDDMINNMTEDEKNEIIENKDEITKDFAEVSKLQETMVNNVKSLEPLLNKAEKFMNKYGKYAKISQKYL